MYQHSIKIGKTLDQNWYTRVVAEKIDERRCNDDLNLACEYVMLNP